MTARRQPRADTLEQVRAAREQLRAARAHYVDAIARARADGHTLEAIAATLGVSRQRVHQLLADRGSPKRVIAAPKSET